MSAVIAVANQKGGCGKTTLSMNLAGVLSGEGGLKVLLIDADPQASAQQWAMRAGEAGMSFEVMTHPHEDIHRKVREMSQKGYDVILVDKPPGRTRTGEEALSVAEDVFRVDGVAVQVLRTEVTARQAFVLAPTVGKTVTSYEPDGKAAGEIRSLAEEIAKCLQTSAVA